jgi:predicted nucleic acid-binding protein
VTSVSIQSLESAIPAGDRILLDTTTLAAYLDSSEAVHPIAKHVVEEFVGNGRNEALISMITVMELLVRPMRATPPGHHTVMSFIRNQQNMTAVEIDLQIAQDAAFLRAAHRFSPPDALVVGTGLAAQVGHLITNDYAWDGRLAPMRARINVCVLARHLS